MDMQFSAIALGQRRERRLISSRRCNDNGLIFGITLCCLCPRHDLLISLAVWHRPCNQEKRLPVERAAQWPSSTVRCRFLDELPSTDFRAADQLGDG